VTYPQTPLETLSLKVPLSSLYITSEKGVIVAKWAQLKKGIVCEN
jgi:hypothetical protein